MTNKFETAGLDLAWDVTDGFKVETGAIYRRFDFDTIGYQRDSTVAGPSRVRSGSSSSSPCPGAMQNDTPLGSA